MQHEQSRFSDELTALQFRLGRWGWPIHAGVVASAAAFLLNDGAPAAEVSWLAAQATLSFILVVYCRRGQFRTHWGYVALTGLVGVTWGVGGVITAHFGRPLDLMFLTTVIGGTALGAVAIQHPRLSAAITSLGTALPLLAGTHLWARGTQGIAMSVMIVLFGATLLLLGRQMNRSLRRNIILLAERESLVALLSEKVSQLEEASREAIEARREAERANDGKSRFLAQASHDLRQPLHAIGLFVECLKDQYSTPEADHLIGRIDASLENLSSLFTSLLDISMLDVGNIRLRPSRFAVQPLLQGLKDQFIASASDRGISMSFVPCSLWVDEDRALLFRIIQNILSNSVKYAPGARIVVGCRRRGDTFDIEIHDSGPGIPAADLERIFDEFTRATVVEPDAPPGLGLGLAIVRRLADLLGLMAELQSAEGRGTVFRLRGLKAAPAVAAAPKTALAASGDGLLKGLSTLLVDDDRQIMSGTSALLTRWGCRVATAASSAEALDQLRAMAGCDVLITDYDLPGGLNGLQLIKAARDASAVHLPAILVSGVPASDIQQQLAGARVLTMNKPVRPAQLRSALMSLRVAKPAELDVA